MAEIGPRQVVQYAKRFGFPRNIPPYLSLALGAAEATLVEMTSAYSAFPNQGVRMTPYSVITIADREGNVLEENRPEPHEAIRADTAFVMTNLLRGVVQRGTAAAAAALDWPLAGKTGTMDDYTDAWFVGFDPNITVGVWVGHDEKKPLGPNETGATAALPIWMDFMRAYIDKRGDRTEAAAVRGARQHRVRDARLGHQRSVHQRHAAAAGRSPGGAGSAPESYRSRGTGAGRGGAARSPRHAVAGALSPRAVVILSCAGAADAGARGGTYA